MFIVRETFVARPGQASKLAGMIKRAVATGNFGRCRVLTDYIAGLNNVILETEVEDLSEFERHMREYSADPAFKEHMQGYADLYLTGRREVYRIWQ